VQVLGAVDARSDRRERDQVQVLERPERAQVEDGAEVDVETLLALARENLAVPAREAVNSALRERRVCGRGARTDVARRTREPRAKRCGLSVLGSVHGVELRAVPASAVDGRDLDGVVSERWSVLYF